MAKMLKILAKFFAKFFAKTKETAGERVRVQDEFADLYKHKLDEHEKYSASFNKLCADTAKRVAELAVDTMRNEIANCLSNLPPDEKVPKDFYIPYKSRLLKRQCSFEFVMYSLDPSTEEEEIYVGNHYIFDLPDGLDVEKSYAKIENAILEHFEDEIRLCGLTTTKNPISIKIRIPLTESTFQLLDFSPKEHSVLAVYF